MTYNLHSTDYLLGVVESLDRPTTVLLDLFFPDMQTFDTEMVHFDVVDRARRLAPFVSPLVEGKAERSRGYATRSFTPPYIKPKHVLEPDRAFKRRAGERLTGALSPQERFDLALADNLRLEDEQIARREEVMASEILRTGSITCAGDEYPTQTIDFGRDAALTVALSGGSRWGQSGVKPFENLKTWAVTVAKKSGAHPGVVIMDPLAAALFQADDAVKTILDNRRQAGGEMQFLPQATGAQGQEIVRIGALGQFEVYQYSSLYTDADGTEQNVMPDNTVIMGNRALAEGIRLYGAIKDARALNAAARWPKMWEQEDPSVVYTMTQSSPLPTLRRPNATFCATVA